MKLLITLLFAAVLPLTAFAGHTVINYSGTEDRWSAGAVKYLLEYLEASTGEKPLLNVSTASEYTINLEVRAEKGDDPETFRLSSPGPGRILISGASTLALRHGVCEFLERCVGIRWLFTGKNGEYIPACRKYKLPGKPLVMTPAYSVRSFSLNNKPNREWAAKNKGIFHYDYTHFPDRPWFHHNLCNLVTVQKYGSSNPEFFPLIKGRRMIPEKKQHIFWQHCFTAPGITAAYIRDVNKAFSKRKNLQTVSFGVNDGGGFCECETCLKVDGKDPQNRIRSYLRCFDEVVRSCYLPGRTFGFLAYGAIRKAPEDGRKYHHALKPFLTYERLYWCDPAKKAKDQQETLAWSKTTGSGIGWYDYLSYRHFLIPKISLNVTPEAIRWGAANNVRYYYAEAHPAPDWHTGPMLTILLKLLWDPAADVDAVVRDWCVAAVGPEAAIHLENYFRLCSKYWEEEVPQTVYFKTVDRSGQYLNMGSSGYLERVDEKLLRQMQNELEKTVTKAAPYGRERAQMFLDGFKKRLPQIRGYLENSKLQKELGSLNFKTVLKEDFNKKRLWTTWQRKDSKGKFYYSSDDGRNNSGAMAMDMRNAGKAMVYMRNAKAVPGKVYRATIYVRNRNSLPGAQMSLRIAWGAPGKAWLDPAFEKTVSVTEDGAYFWRKLTVSAVAPNVEGCFIKIVASGSKLKKGEIFFDDFTLEEAERNK